MSVTNTSSSALMSFAQDINYIRTEGFKRYKPIYNQKNTRAACNDPQGAYPMVEEVYNAIKSSGCLQQTFDALSLQDFITSGLITVHCHLMHLSLAPYYAVQMKRCMQK